MGVQNGTDSTNPSKVQGIPPNREKIKRVVNVYPIFRYSIIVNTGNSSLVNNQTEENLDSRGFSIISKQSATYL